MAEETEELRDGPLMASNDDMEVLRVSIHDRTRVVIHALVNADNRARMAMALIERWGMVCAEDGGEDSAGRHQFKLMPTQSVVDRAVETVEKAMGAFREKGWLVDTPSYKDFMEDAKNSNR